MHVHMYCITSNASTHPVLWTHPMLQHIRCFNTSNKAWTHPVLQHIRSHIQCCNASSASSHSFHACAGVVSHLVPWYLVLERSLVLLALCSDVVVLWSAALVPSQAGSSLRKLDALQAGSFSFHNCTSNIPGIYQDMLLLSLRPRGGKPWLTGTR